MSKDLENGIRHNIKEFINAIQSGDRELASTFLKEAIAGHTQIRYDVIYENLISEGDGKYQFGGKVNLAGDVGPPVDNVGSRPTLGSAEDEPQDEIAEAWADDENGEYVQINDDGSVWHIAHGSAVEQIVVTNPENPYEDIIEWMRENKFFPNIWKVNDHGNVTMMDHEGNELGGIV